MGAGTGSGGTTARRGRLASARDGPLAPSAPAGACPGTDIVDALWVRRGSPRAAAGAVGATGGNVGEGGDDKEGPLEVGATPRPGSRLFDRVVVARLVARLEARAGGMPATDIPDELGADMG